MDSEIVDSPYASLPTAWLQFREETQAPQSLTNGPQARPKRVRLSPEAEERIKAYIRGKPSKKKGGGFCTVKWPERRDQAQDEALRDDYYIPSSSQNVIDGASPNTQARSRFGFVGDLAGRVWERARQYTTDPPITREMLVLNKVSVFALIDHCRVPMTELYSAGIVENVHDLKALQFTARDLVRTRELFDVNRLCMLFAMDQNGLREAGCEFGLKELRRCEFKQGELEGLAVDVGRIIEEDGGRPKDLIKLGWDYKRLRERGLTKSSLSTLGITREQALDPVPLGLGWSRADYDQLMKSTQ